MAQKDCLTILSIKLGRMTCGACLKSRSSVLLLVCLLLPQQQEIEADFTALGLFADPADFVDPGLHSGLGQMTPSTVRRERTSSVR